MGRLWRHKETKRPESAKQECWILAPELSEVITNPKKCFGKTSFIYSPYVLYRSLKIWNTLKKVELPNEIRDLIEQTYKEDPNEINSMIIYKQQIENEREKLKRLALVGISTAGKTLPENKASTRFNEQTTVDVLLVKEITHN